MQKPTLEKVLWWISSTKHRAPHSQWNMVIEIKRVFKIYRQSISRRFTSTNLSLWHLHKGSNVLNVLHASLSIMSKGWYLYWNLAGLYIKEHTVTLLTLRCPREWNQSAYDCCLFTFEHHRLIKVENVITEIQLFFSSEIIECVRRSQGYLPVISPVPCPLKVHQGRRWNQMFTGLARKKITFPLCLCSNTLDRFDTFILS